MTLRMRVLPRFPATITATNGLTVERPTGTPNLIVKPDFGQLVQIPNVGNGDEVFFIAWDRELELYRIMSFNDLFSGVAGEFMPIAVYDPQGIAGDAFARANHTGVQAISTITGLQTALDNRVRIDAVQTFTGPQQLQGRDNIKALGLNNIVGTVSQSGGVPTGAIIETGSNANGSYVRFADGTQICWVTLNIAGGSTTAAGSLFTSAASTLQNWPAAFTAKPVIGMQGVDNRGGQWGSQLTAATASQTGTYRVTALSSGGTSATVDLVAIGRWF